MIPYAKDRFSKENVNIFTLLVSDYQNFITKILSLLTFPSFSA